MSRNRSHHLYVEGGVRLDHLAKVILERYPDARISTNTVELDLGVPETNTVVEPVTDAETAVAWGIDNNFKKLRGIRPEVDDLLDMIERHPDIQQLRKSLDAKRKKNQAAGLKAAKFEDSERHELQRLLAKRAPLRD